MTPDHHDQTFAEAVATSRSLAGAQPEAECGRLIEIFDRAGQSILSDEELLELLLLPAAPRKGAKVMSRQLIAIFGGIDRVLAAPIRRLRLVPDMDSRTIRTIKIIESITHRVVRSKIDNRPLLSSWDAVLDYCHTLLSAKESEHFIVFFLDKKNYLLEAEELGKGTVDHVPVYPREVVKRALELNACGLILVHNHPTGDPTPSTQDIETTRRIQAGAENLGILLHDHIVIGKSCETSFRELGFL